MFNTMNDLFPSTPMGGDDASSLPFADPRYSFSAVPTPSTPSSTGGVTSYMNQAVHVGVKAERFHVSVSVTELYFNRMQWYPVTLKFTDDRGQPTLVSRKVKVDEHSVFFDARKKSLESHDDLPEDTVTVRLEGLCAEFRKQLIKCDKDRQLIMSKRKDDTKKWNDEDDVNNERLLQVVPPPPAEERIRPDGTITIKLRVSCCVGVVKQHHSNHKSDSEPEPVTHKGCPGLAIQADVSTPDHTEHAVGATSAIHVVGKVSAAERKKAEDLNDEKEEEASPLKTGLKRTRAQAESEVQPKFRSGSKAGNNSYLENTSYSGPPILPEEDMEEEHASKRLYDMARTPPQVLHYPLPPAPWTPVSYPYQTPNPAPPLEVKLETYMATPATHMPVIPAVFQADLDSGSALILHKIFRQRGHADPTTALHSLALRYKKNFDTIFPTPLRDIYEPPFFSEANLRKINAESPTMFAIFSVIGCITCGMSVEMADDIWGAALKLVAKFSKVDPKWTQREVLLIADTFNRIATYFGAIGGLDKARSYLATAASTLATLPDISHDAHCKPIYESLLWTKSTYSIDMVQLPNSYQWAKECGRMNAQIYSLFVMTIYGCYPDIARDPNELGFRASESRMDDSKASGVLGVVANLKELLVTAGYPSVKDGRHTYEALFASSFGALEYWVNGNLVEAAKKISGTVLPSALLTNPQIEAYIPLYLAAFVALQLAKYDQVQMVDYAELHLRQLMKINIMRWARNLIDHLINRLEVICGESSGLTWTELTRENCVQLGLCGPTVSVTTESPAPTDDAGLRGGK